jgi:membrane-associated PAP2 superfamily phosphatase
MGGSVTDSMQLLVETRRSCLKQRRKKSLLLDSNSCRFQESPVVDEPFPPGIATGAQVRSELHPTTLAEFWWRHARIPLVALFVVTVAVSTTRLDQSIAHWLFFDAAQQRWIGAGNWWVNAVVHVGGRWAIRGVVVAGLILWLGTFVYPRWRALRRPSLYFTVAMILAIGIVGLLKVLTNVDCPWDLQEFGGRFPYVHLFADRPDALRHARCFPAAHASSGYALMALYFVTYERNRQLARIGLIVGLLAGLVFGITQQSRGAHFLSHDAWSACITWVVSLSLYTVVFRARAWSVAAPS